MGDRPLGGTASRGQASLEKIAARRSLPVEHLPGKEEAGEGFYHQVFIQGFKGNTTCRGDCLRNGSRAGEGDREVLG